MKGTIRGTGASQYMYQWTGAIDSKRRKFVAIGGGEVYSWDIGASGSLTARVLNTTGATEIISSGNFADGRPPGFVYDPVTDTFVAWNGGANVYTLNMDSLKWTKVTPASTNTVVPTAGDANGTFGRFRYSPKKNIFVVVSNVDQNVYLYKLAPGGGSSDTTPPGAPRSLVVR
jgi:hypothetical protein